jgi:PadR family transcriptional regulator PadR
MEGDDPREADVIRAFPSPQSPATFSLLLPSYALEQYVAMQHIRSRMLDRELKKGSAELLILSLVEDQPRHGYDLSKLIEARSEGVLKFRVASLYPLLYRLEKRGWILGRWIEKAGQRRRRYYRLTPAGAAVLASQRDTWRAFAEAINRIAGVDHA